MPAVNTTWNDATADWNTPADWSDDIVPNDINTNVTLDSSSVYRVTISLRRPFQLGRCSSETPAAVLGLHNGASLSFPGGFTSRGGLEVDNSPNFNGEGGSSLTITGTLINSKAVQIGNPCGLTNSSGASFALYGSASHAAMLAFCGGPVPTGRVCVAGEGEWPPHLRGAAVDDVGYATLFGSLAWIPLTLPDLAGGQELWVDLPSDQAERFKFDSRMVARCTAASPRFLAPDGATGNAG